MGKIADIKTTRNVYAATLAVVLCIGVAHAAPRTAVRSMLEMRQEGVVLQKWDLSCGAAALATLLSLQYGDTVSERDVAVSMMQRTEYMTNPELVRVREGFSLLDLKRFVESRGYQGVGMGKLSARDLEAHAPLITPINVTGYNHFVVVRGVRDGWVSIADPAFGNREMRVRQFERVWIDDPQVGHIGFLVRRGR